MTLNGNPDETNGYNSVIKNGDVADADLVKAVFSPIGSVTSWLKTFGTADSGTTDGTTASKLVDSTQTDFLTTVSIGMIVHNTTDDTFANVTAIDSNTILSIDSDIMTTGEAYIIYKTPQLPDGWVECDGSVLSDSDSPYNGETIPNYNATTPISLDAATLIGGLNTDTQKSGHNLSTKEHYVRVTTITKYSTTPATMAYIMDTSDTILASASFSGNDATFDYVLSPFTDYKFGVDAGGASFLKSGNTTGGYPHDYIQLTLNSSFGAGNGSWSSSIESISTQGIKSQLNGDEENFWIMRVK